MSDEEHEQRHDEHAIAQQDELDSLAAIFADDFALVSGGGGRDGPISYSIRIRPDPDHADADGGYLALTVAYPPSYPDVAPAFSLAYHRHDHDDDGEIRRYSSPPLPPLHPVQERALLGAVDAAARSEAGMPCVYGCVRAADEFVEGGGLAQAGVSLLSDDCLALILSFAASSVDEVRGTSAALPVFGRASRSNAVWRGLCRTRWGGRWGFRARWEGALEKFHGEEGGDDDENFWMRTYHEEEEDAARTSLSRDEICGMKFDLRQWFSHAAFLGQPDGMRDVLPSGLRESLAGDAVFAATGEVLSDESRWLGSLRWESKTVRGTTEVRLRRGGCSVESLLVHRLLNWGWELRGSDYVLRALDDGCDVPTLWEDFTATIVLQDKPGWIVPHRAPYPYSCREIPDDDDCKMMLDW